MGTRWRVWTRKGACLTRGEAKLLNVGLFFEFVSVFHFEFIDNQGVELR